MPFEGSYAKLRWSEISQDAAHRAHSGQLTFPYQASLSLSPPTVQLIQDIFHKLCHALLIFPQFSFGNGLMQLARMDIEVQILSGYGVEAYKNPFGFDCLGWMFIASFLQGLVFFSLRLLLNKYTIHKLR